MLEAAVLRRFEELIRARAGIQMREQEAALLSQTLRTRMAARRFASPPQYLDFLAASTPDAQEEWKALFVLLTNQESYFFRDAEQLQVIREQLLPVLLQRNRETRTLRIWSAGCSTGEEPYSLAMMLEDVVPSREEWRVLILGTDLSEAALERARRGVYGAWSFRALSEGVRDRFFVARGKEWEVRPQLRHSITWAHGNLFDDPFPTSSSALHDMDLIVCRNVFIYFGRDAVTHVLRKFSATLRPEGFLVTGHAELHGAPLGDLQARSFPQSVIYQCGSASIPDKVPSQKAHTPPRFPSAPLPAPNVVAPTPKKAAPLPKAEPSDALAQATAWIGQGRPVEALQLLKTCLERQPSDLAALCLAAQAQANLGRLDEAEVLCQRAIAVSSFAALPYQMLARIAAERGDAELAKSLLKKVIYLNPSLVRAYLELSAIYAREDDAPRAAQMKRAALSLLSDQNEENWVPSEPYAVEERLTVGEIKRQLGGSESIRRNKTKPAFAG